MDEALDDEKRDILYELGARQCKWSVEALSGPPKSKKKLSDSRFLVRNGIWVMVSPGQSLEATPASTKWRRRAIVAGWIITGAGFGLFAVTIPFVIPALRKYCLPYVPATPVQIRTVVRQLKGRTGKVVDLGSGDGRVVRTDH